MKKIAIAVTVVVALMLALAIPAFADQPENPGSYGERVSGQAHEEKGQDPVQHRSERIHRAIENARAEGTNLGQKIKLTHEVNHGIPPGHTP